MAKLLSFQDTKPMHFSPERSTSPNRQWTWRKLFGRDNGSLPPARPQPEDPKDDLSRKRAKRAVPGLPRPGTFKRQQSELRENLEPVKSLPNERRAFSVDPRRGESLRGSSRTSVPSLPRTSAPGLLGMADGVGVTQEEPETIAEAVEPRPMAEDNAEPPPPSNDVFIDDDLEEELEKRWILNLSMHFRDRSNREKFFVTFAETPTHWRRVTVSVDYRDASPNSLELELQHTQYQRDKSAKIYEAIRDSLLDIQFYDTVTNLKLATENERLHVHVTEDINEVIHFPPVSAIGHLPCRRVKEKDVEFDSHLSGFVYKVNVGGHVLIKKEIPGPDTVDEFLYEVNALYQLSDSDSVIRFGGVITDNEGRHLKGLLISYAEQGALIDVLYDGKGHLPWSRRERWAKQIVQGLSEIHEAGFVQGDFTLSNIVIDGEDKAKIIDINRRGCPVGWEPPEVAALIESKQRIAMYIGVKSDIFQLGMVLWAIAMQQDEPDIQPRPLSLASAPEEIPGYYRDLVHTCLSDNPKRRRNTSYLLDLFPELEDGPRLAPDDSDVDAEEHQHHYIDPATAVNREDIERFRRLASPAAEHPNMDIISTGSHTYVNPPTDISGEAYFFPTRGRSPTRLPIEETQLGHSSNVSPLNVGHGTNAEDMASPEGEPIVVDVSPERHYLGQNEPSTIDVAYANAESMRAASNGFGDDDEDDMSIELNDAARASIEEYRQRRDEFEDCLEPAELLTSQVYQPQVDRDDHSMSRCEDSYATPPRSVVGDDLDLQQSYADMAETTYFDPTAASDNREDLAAPEIATPALCEEGSFLTPQQAVKEEASLSVRSAAELPYPNHGAFRTPGVVLEDTLAAQASMASSTNEMPSSSNITQAEDEANQLFSSTPAALEVRPTYLEQAREESVPEALSSGWIEEASVDQTTADPEESYDELGEAPIPRDLRSEPAKENPEPPEPPVADSSIQPPHEDVRTGLTLEAGDETRTEPAILAVRTVDIGELKLGEGRVDSGFATHYDPESPTSRRVDDSPIPLREEP